MGSPMVFHTAPPQPASNARITWSPVLVGGAEASQNGFGLSMPARFTFRSATGHLRRTTGLDVGRHAGRGALALGHRVHHFLAAGDAISAGEVARVRGLHGALVDHHPAA